MPEKIRHRIRFTFWLDLLVPEQEKLADDIELLKNERSFVRTIRDGLRLILDLRAGRFDVLEELFPMIVSGIEARMSPPPPDNSDLERQIAELKRLILEQGSISAPPPNYPQSKSASAPPVVEKKVAALPDAGAIADNFLAFIQ